MSTFLGFYLLMSAVTAAMVIPLVSVRIDGTDSRLRHSWAFWYAFLPLAIVIAIGAGLVWPLLLGIYVGQRLR